MGVFACVLAFGALPFCVVSGHAEILAAGALGAGLDVVWCDAVFA